MSKEDSVAIQSEYFEQYSASFRVTLITLFCTDGKKVKKLKPEKDKEETEKEKAKEPKKKIKSVPKKKKGTS